MGVKPWKFDQSWLGGLSYPNFNDKLQTKSDGIELESENGVD